MLLLCASEEEGEEEGREEGESVSSCWMCIAFSGGLDLGSGGGDPEEVKGASTRESEEGVLERTEGGREEGAGGFAGVAVAIFGR